MVYTHPGIPTMVYTHPTTLVYTPPFLSRVGFGFNSGFNSGLGTAVFYTFRHGVKEERPLCAEFSLFSPQNKPSPSQETGEYDQETRYRKHSHTRPAGISQPLLKVSQTPRKVLARPSTRFTVGQYPGPWPPES